jgi:hypothetical protein
MRVTGGAKMKKFLKSNRYRFASRYKRSLNLILPLLLVSFFSTSFASASTQKEGEMSQHERIVAVFNDLNKDNLSILDEFYAREVEFADPLGVHKGLDAVKGYYRGLYQGVQSIRFDFTESIAKGNKHSVYWTMYLKAKGLAGGEEIKLTGNSLIIFSEESNKVTYHRDYFDMGEFIYEHIPLLGYAVRVVKKKLKSE